MAYSSLRRSYGKRSASMKHDFGKTFYRKKRVASAGESKHRKASKTTVRRRGRTLKIAKLFKIVVAKKSRRR